MKKLFALVLTLVLALFMTACGGNKPTEGSKENSSVSTEVSDPSADLNWPKKTIQITVPFAAGGDTDLYARKCAEYLEEKLGITVVVANTAGAGGVTGAMVVADSTPDGYSILFNHYGKLIQEVCESTGGLSFLDDFTAGCSVLVDNSYTLCAAASTGISDYDSFVKYATEHPGELSIVAAANSNGWDIVSKIENAAGLSFNKVEGPSSVTERVAAILGGQHDLIYGNYNSLSDYIENGDLCVIGSIGEERCKAHSEVPCLTELSGNPVVSPYIFSFSFPQGTDQAIIDAFDAAMEEICEDADFIAEVEAMGGNVNFAAGTESDAAQREELAQIKERLGL